MTRKRKRTTMTTNQIRIVTIPPMTAPLNPAVLIKLRSVMMTPTARE